MILLNGLGVGILLICHYLVWINTTTFKEFIVYVLIMNSFGILTGVPAGLIVGRKIVKKRREANRKSYLNKILGRG